MANSALTLTITYVRSETLRPNPWNPNRQDDITRAKERRSIREHGFVDPITVRIHPESLRIDATPPVIYEIIDGEHRWMAAKEEGLAEVPIVCLGAVADGKAKRLTILLNELRGRSEPTRLAELLTSLEAKADALAEELPYSAVEIDSLMSSLDQFGWGEEKVLENAADHSQKAGKGLEEVRFQLGAVKGNVPRRLADDLLEVWRLTAEKVGSRSPEAVLASWAERLRSG